LTPSYGDESQPLALAFFLLGLPVLCVEDGCGDRAAQDTGTMRVLALAIRVLCAAGCLGW
jgi:hypothetical protein